MPERPRIGFVSLGCPKNLVDSEVMMGMVHHAGAELTPAAEDADIIVVNTCSFIDSAKQESVNTILEMVAHKTGGRARKLIVTGCLVERYRDEIQKNIPEVDAVLGTGELDGILRAAGLTPKPVPQSGPFNILSESASQQVGNSATPVNGDPSMAQLEHGAVAVNAHSHDHVHLELGGAAALQVEAAQGNLSSASIAESNLIDRASSAVRKHSQMDVPQQTSRPEGDLRERNGRFNRDAWDGATAELPSYLYSDDTPRILTTPRASAYIKIAEGCDHPCGFCIIPQLRGKFRSRRISSILNEAENLMRQGVREFTLIGQDTTCFGEDLGLRDGLATLLEALATMHVEGIGKIKWLRFLYAYPNKVTTKLLETIAAHDNIAKYLDVPLQHAAPATLKRMKRGGSGDIFLRMIDKARTIVPGIAIRTAFIVGFPGETDAEFEELESFIKAAKIDWLGVFSYSDEEGAAAFDLGEKVPKRTIEARRRRLMRTQLKISAKARAAQVGREVEVLVEGPSEETELLWQARTMQQAPEIDGHVLINDFGDREALVPGTFYRAEITEAHDYDVVARILD
ncbi:MiaB/RimO family radical SAM methylthiotransferase [Terriglobus roseus]|uniref:Ribosomal protein uS12 methylthiotransferase RimO n=1 Tax=Terriglobus roseus TaxID=392734 RepID=A0A1H4KIH9_9BACT|nr:MiaB/RimO family radical SAM methylthiotransferase [Terriglobus roseus]SEB58267.1 ribosomal protein S12 methylthiotransferase [Terriglobus roseus]